MTAMISVAFNFQPSSYLARDLMDVDAFLTPATWNTRTLVKIMMKALRMNSATRFAETPTWYAEMMASAPAEISPLTQRFFENHSVAKHTMMKYSIHPSHPSGWTIPSMLATIADSSATPADAYNTLLIEKPRERLWR